MNKFLSLLILTAFIASCTSEIEMEEMRLVDVDLLFTPKQTLPASNGHFYLEMTHTDALDCNNSFFVDSLSVDNTANPGVFSLVVDGVDTEGTCVTADDEVFLSQSYDIPEGLKDYDFMITNQGITSEGKLRVMEDRLTIAFLSADGFELAKTELKRVPEGIAWGAISLGIAERDIATEFTQLQTPDAVGSQLADLQLDGDYGFFTINDFIEVTEINGQTDFEQSFLLSIQNDADWVMLQELLSKIEQGFPDLSYEIYNSEGESLIKG